MRAATCSFGLWNVTRARLVAGSRLGLSPLPSLKRSALDRISSLRASMPDYGLVRVAAAVPQVRVADCSFNAGRILEMMRQAETQGISVLVFPEQSITAYTCADLFHHFSLQKAAMAALVELAHASAVVYSGLAVVG